MKRLFYNLVFISLITLTSCFVDDGSIDVAESSSGGVRTTDLTIDPNSIFILDGPLIMAEGTTLTIPAGTQIIAEEGNLLNQSAIIILPGAKINAMGTASDPIVITSATGSPGEWGGIVVFGKAETTAGDPTSGGLATAEIGGFEYGGNDPTDNSGTIEHVILVGTGQQINANSQYNGFSFYAVGSGTVINNIAVLDGADDGVEFFGGSAVVSNVYLKDLADDSIDWTEGWNGSLTTAYIEHTKTGFSTVIEADGPDNQPTLEDITAVGPGVGLALQFKKQSGANLININITGYDNLFAGASGFGPGLTENSVSFDNFNGGIDFIVEPTETEINAGTTPVPKSDFAWVTAAL